MSRRSVGNRGAPRDLADRDERDAALADDAADAVEKRRAKVAVVVLAPPERSSGGSPAVCVRTPGAPGCPMSLHVATLPQKEVGRASWHCLDPIRAPPARYDRARQRGDDHRVATRSRGQDGN